MGNKLSKGSNAKKIFLIVVTILAIYIIATVIAYFNLKK